MHQSLATIDSPEFINLQPLDINPLMSSCEIKVLYLGENRNRSYITKDVATEMSKTLRGAPIVGYYREEKEDFADHGDKVIIDDQGVHFECMTIPYGFVAPDAKVWFQKFEDFDDFGNSVIREYLMTTGYLWTGQFPECKCAVEGDGKPHSMELDNETLQGEWSNNIKQDMEFFIINDAVFSKLCILGDDVEPCFEGSSVTAPKVSSTFSLDDDFKNTLFNMMQDLKFALEGGQEKMALLDNTEKTLDNSNKNVNKDFELNTEGQSENSDVSADFEKKKEEKAPTEEPVKDEEKKDEYACGEDKKKEEDYACGDKEDKKKEFAEKKDEEENKEPKDKEENKSDESKDEEDKKEEKKFSLEEYSALETKFSELESQYNELQSKYQALVSFKEEIENEKKDALINSFYMLSDEDKKDVIENKTQYSLDDIEAKLSVICVRKKVNFESEEEVQSDVATTFSLNGQQDSLPAWINAVKNTQNGRY